MALDFFGQMFEGIGKTFEAGANVNLGQIGERMQKRQLEYDRAALYAGADADRLGYLLNISKQETTIITVVTVGAILMVIMLIIFR